MSYKSTSGAINDLLGGRLDLMFDSIGTAIAHIQEGRVRVIGVSTRTRKAVLPDVPTLSELGLAGFEVVSWTGLYAPRRTPPAVVNRLVGALQGSLRDPMFAGYLTKSGLEPVSMDKATPESHRAWLKSEIERWGEVIRKAGIAPQ